MEDRIDKDAVGKEPGEDQLHELIKEAGEEVRLQNKKMMEKHRKMVQEAVAKGAARRRNHLAK